MVADLLSRLVKNYVESQVIEETTKDLIDRQYSVIRKAVDEVVLKLLFRHELLPNEIYIKIKKVHNSVVGHCELEMIMSRLALQGQT